MTRYLYGKNLHSVPTLIWINASPIVHFSITECVRDHEVRRYNKKTHTRALDERNQNIIKIVDFKTRHRGNTKACASLTV